MPLHGFQKKIPPQNTFFSTQLHTRNKILLRSGAEPDSEILFQLRFGAESDSKSLRLWLQTEIFETCHSLKNILSRYLHVLGISFGGADLAPPRIFQRLFSGIFFKNREFLVCFGGTKNV